ncbi:MAG TPA: hypothetical protein VN613_07635 [Gemmatimonadaceae bacterium]|nr:hypothetical protein [Gemmatimonadaceae bacterium]
MSVKQRTSSAGPSRSRGSRPESRRQPRTPPRGDSRGDLRGDSTPDRRTDLRADTARWLGGHQWDHFITLTTSGAETFTVDALGRAFANYVAGVEATIGHAVRWFRVIEGVSTPGARPHLHALLYGTFGVGTRALRSRHLWRHGNVNVKRYDPALGAVGYLVKELGNAAEWDAWDVSATMPPMETTPDLRASGQSADSTTAPESSCSSPAGTPDAMLALVPSTPSVRNARTATRHAVETERIACTESLDIGRAADVIARILLARAGIAA